MRLWRNIKSCLLRNTRTGIHGANRLASNSLLEGIVFGRRIALKVSEMLMNEKNNQKHHARFFVKTERMNKGYNSKEAILSIKQTMTELVGIEMTYDTLNEALQRVVEIKKEIADMNNTTFDDYVLQNMVLLAELAIKAAIMREESRGAHYRSDFKETKDEWKVHIVFSKDNIVREE